MHYARPTATSALLGTLALFAAACSDSNGPTGTPIVGSSPSEAVIHNAASAGVPYGPFHLPEANYAAPFTATIQMPSSPNGLLKILNTARQKHMRVLVRLAGGKDNYQNADGSFNLSMWKTKVSAYKGVDLSGYVADGTLVGHYLFDEPHAKNQWNGKPVPPNDVEGAAQYSKQLWPYLTTFIRSDMSYLQGKTDWVYLDAGWEQFSAKDGPVTDFITREVAFAQRLKLGLVAGLNVLDGGSGESGIRGYSSGKWAMSAAEVKSFGSALLANSGVCGFFTWKYDPTYYGRSDIRQSMAALGQAAASHPATPCRVH
jgi:hypothetical protein